MTEKWTSNELVMICSADPQRYIVGKLQLPQSAYEAIDVEKDSPEHDVLLYCLTECARTGLPAHLVEARAVITMLQMNPNTGISMGTQALPISLSFCPASIYVKVDTFMLPSEMSGMTEKITQLLDDLKRQEMMNTARDAGLFVPGMHDVRKT